MRFLELHLLAFGPFTDFRLDLRAEGPAFHLLYGHNEAGKSTALRALSALLYGIPQRTQDAHLHPMPKLRIGATLEGETGASVQLVRRKGLKNDLLDAQGSPIDEAILRRLLGGISEQHFQSVFGLDHDRLREGAHALLSGHGDIGESLFDAGWGGQGIHEVLKELEQEAERIFTPQAHKRKLNSAIKDFKEANKNIRKTELSAETWAAHVASVQEAKLLRESLAQKRQALIEERSHLLRIKRILPILAARSELEARVKKLGARPTITEETIEERMRTQRSLEEAELEIEWLAQERAERLAQLESLRYESSLAALSEDSMADLQSRLGAQRAERRDLPKRRAELQLLRQSVQNGLERLGRGGAIASANKLRIPVDRQARIRTLASEHGSTATEARHSSRELEKQTLKTESLTKKLEALGAGEETTALRRSLASARKLGEVDREIGEREQALRVKVQEAEDHLGTLSPWTGDRTSVLAHSVPAPESVDEYVRREGELRKEEQDLRERTAELETRKDEIQAELDELSVGAGIPSETQLSQERTERDLHWRALRDSWSGREVQPTDKDLSAYETSVTIADQTADRLRREADRVARHGRLLADQVVTAAELSRRRERLEEIKRARVEQQEEWVKLWSSAGFTPTSPDEMSLWLRRFDRARDVAREARGLGTALDRRITQRAQQAEELLSKLQERGQASIEDEPFETLVERASDVLTRIERRQEERVRLTEEREAMTQQLEGLRVDLGARETALAEWENRWEAEMKALGLAANALPQEATRVLDELEQLHHNMEAAEQLEARIGQMEDNGVAIGTEVRRLVDNHCPDLAPLVFEEQADALLRAYRTARSDATKHDEINSVLEEKDARLTKVKNSAQAWRSRLEALMRTAGAHDLESLIEAEARARELRRHLLEIEKADRRLMEEGEGAPLSQLSSEAQTHEPTAVRVRVEELGHEISGIQDRLDQAIHHLATLEAELKSEGERTSVTAAEEAEAHLTRVRAHAQRYVRVRLAATVLRREIERYQEKHQGPILMRVNELFPRLTDGNYTGVQVGLGSEDHPVLKCLRRNGEEVEVEGLSDGTRDQLYLALRVASLERHATLNEPMPVILDDILIHFDDDRARAALGVLGELASTCQVLFFTHHGRLTELAREAIPNERLKEHDLGEIPSPQQQQSAPGPLLS